jgi:hypothetical protein
MKNFLFLFIALTIVAIFGSCQKVENDPITAIAVQLNTTDSVVADDIMLVLVVENAFFKSFDNVKMGENILSFSAKEMSFINQKPAYFAANFYKNSDELIYLGQDFSDDFFIKSGLKISLQY